MQPPLRVKAFSIRDVGILQIRGFVAVGPRGLNVFWTRSFAFSAICRHDVFLLLRFAALAIRIVGFQSLGYTR